MTLGIPSIRLVQSAQYIGGSLEHWHHPCRHSRCLFFINRSWDIPTEVCLSLIKSPPLWGLPRRAWPNPLQWTSAALWSGASSWHHGFHCWLASTRWRRRTPPPRRTSCSGHDWDSRELCLWWPRNGLKTSSILGRISSVAVAVGNHLNHRDSLAIFCWRPDIVTQPKSRSKQQASWSPLTVVVAMVTFHLWRRRYLTTSPTHISMNFRTTFWARTFPYQFSSFFWR